MELDPLVLSRMQFAFVVSFHAIFPVFTIGLASYIALLHGLFFKTNNPAWDRLALFWTKVFAVVFGMGVVSGIVMSFQFGTNWSNFSQAASNFLGPVLSYEVVTAFFLEAAFLGVLLFGRGKVPQGVHLFAAIMVAIGTFISSFWILSANSWMHTPAGVELIDYRFHVVSWTEAIFNPSFPYRFAHMAMASFLTGGFVVAGVSAWFLLRGRDPEANRRALSMCLWLLLFLAPAQAVVGDFHGLNTLEHQPAKVAAMEGHWETSGNVPLLLFAIPDQEAQTNRFEIGIPNLASLILTHSTDGVIQGLNEFAPEEQPPVWIVFWAFRVMVGIGLLMIATALIGLLLRRKGKFHQHTGFLKTLVYMIPMPFVAVLAGWIVTESGRAPWLVYGMMAHAEGVTPSLTGPMALFTLVGYVLVYAVVFYAGIYYLTRVVRNGMLPNEERETAGDNFRRPMRPLSATETPFDDDVDPVRN
ncbi:cytochrome ubiquinol oxidase subunit I [Vreelandella aquamarina]|uniref:Cytochrome bd-I ubiquinol oxidase subunit 1 apoprotein n=1 Tax=Vreelandella aquamarina TaxID=77097 RepID=A0A0D7V263_9GAMM|nr:MULTISPECIES: cytochrome ubiquinol oxidase subunit I [Halomonas]KTG25553.1 cytochrome D ubiquinol oxidase subunit I [Idiomarina sp. H105]OAE96179.1 cytochrome D ubiquinol oxidase subunit I [Idiomarina sp. WRN-38]KJD20328.1 cytochrome D ubiquinol oxidase subunit I [Halomonas meridiana]MCD1651166.1 cytochrome ubiquinol oxidase subunit I [Halomonas axialensis]MCD2087318.1 cytochrome ubiquinol oxidase subunit I [Halomonas meridiana]